MSQAQSRTSVMDPHQHEASPMVRSQAVQEAAQARVRQSPYRDVRNVACNFHEGVLTLRGRVSSYYLKQIAQTLVLRMQCVDEVNNRIEVV